MEPKLDGHRCAVIRTKDDVLLLSRTGKRIQPIPWLQTFAKRHLRPGAYLDGELVASAGYSSHDISSFRAYHPEKLAFVAFDILWDGGRDIRKKVWNFRRHLLLNCTNMAHKWPDDGQLKAGHFYVIRTERYTDTKPLSVREAQLDIWLKQGFEGVVFKNQTGAYKANSRSGWIKLKVTMMTPVIVIDAEGKPSEWRVRPGKTGTDGLVYPEGKHTQPWTDGWVGLRYGYGPDIYNLGGELVEVPGIGICTIVGSLGVTGPAEELASLVGKVALCKCWGTYSSGTLRHPQAEEYNDWDGNPVEPPEPTLLTQKGGDR
jgi:hypothetical protein